MTTTKITGLTYQATIDRHDRSWGNGLDVNLSELNGSWLGQISFIIHPEFDEYEVYQAKSTEQLLAIVAERLESILIVYRNWLVGRRHLIMALNSPQMTPLVDKKYRRELMQEIIIRTCEIEFSKKCPKLWEHLQKTESETTRFCDSCGQNVYYVKTDEEALHHAEQRHCIAKENLERPLYRLEMGKPKRPTPVKVREQLAAVNLDGRKNNALSHLRYTDFRCTECGYPIFPVWRERCLVCGVTVSDHVVEITPQGATE